MKKTSENTRKASNMLGLIVCLSALPLVYGMTGCSTQKSVVQTSPRYNDESPSLVGPRGPDGPAGPVGARGEVGATGAAGPGVAGSVGGQGPAGPAGIPGAVGARGPAGEIAVGQAGPAGAVGQAGAQGAQGATGEVGASTIGATGAVGPAGSAGAQGVAGISGAQGPTLVGPTGPAGRTGPAGEQGAIGDTGAQGSTTAGVVGSTGPAGESGPQGAVGPNGPQGPAGVIGRWTSYRDFWFETDQDGIRTVDTTKLAEIAAYMKQNPSLKIGIDTFTDPNNQELRDRRVNAVRAALVQAGVPANRIGTGSFGAAKPRRYARVEVLITTAGTYTTSQR